MVTMWSCVPGYESNYMISDRGEVKHFPYASSKGKSVKPRLNNAGYLMIDLYKDGKRKCMLLHRLVALTFIPNPRGLEVVNHKDRDRTNCAADNLEWCTQSENILHSYANPYHRKRKPTTL